MSRLTTSPFHKPSPFEFPRGLPSPPETNPEVFSAPVPLVSSMQSSGGQDSMTGETAHPALGGETPTSRLRKSSSIPYHSPSFRDNKDRVSQRISKTLVIVIPPATLLQEHGRSASITSGPYHRLSQGIVMPLLPSMFAQLTAIAREFNFPSTSGICLYYHYTEDGFTLTPRISDDSWQSIWAHLSEPAGPNEKRSLISGKIEFDIDHRIARWYSAWISSIFREVSEMNHYPATAPSYGHGRAESRTTLPDGRVFDDDDGSVIIQHSAPVTRHVPRKLSLVERFETASARPEFKAAPRSIGSPPEILPSASQAPVLSPIVQEEEPKTARQDLNSRVKTWRASAILTPTPLALTGQTSLEPVNLPNAMSAELKMEDYSWSISSPGPSSYAEKSPLASEYSRIASVHLDSRLMGSVCSTPSIRTSNGPSDYDPFSPSFMAFEYMPTPDVAQRFFEDSPPTPLTATSWGAPLSYPPSPRNLEVRVPSPDIAQRMFENSPSTPMTATSWGAPLSYPPSRRSFSPVPSVDLGDRSRFDDAASQHSEMSHSMWRASLARARSEETVRNWNHVWPYTEHGNATSVPDVHATTRVWAHVWPYNHRMFEEPSRVANWQHVWPYNAKDMTHYPHNLYCIYPPVSAQAGDDAYPYNLSNIYPPTPSVQSNPIHAAGLGYPHNLANIYSSITSRLSADALHGGLGYPHNLLNIYADITAYPHNLANIYPVVHSRLAAKAPYTGTGYPHNLANIYADISAYPHNLAYIYPSAVSRLAASGPYTGTGYPHNLSSIYADISAYPHNLASIYPPITSRLAAIAPRTGLGYPHNLSNIYVDISAYPHNLSRIYPSAYVARRIVQGRGYPHNLAEIYPALSSRVVLEGKREDASLVEPLESYPYNLLNIYPPGYPHNLLSIYPPVCIDQRTRYSSYSGSPGYPHNLSLIYPPVFRKESESAFLKTVGYPHNLYLIYPPVYARQRCVPSKTLSENYPLHLKQLYPPVYPHNLVDIYPPIHDEARPSAALSTAPDAKVSSTLGYPHNLARIYPAIDPYPRKPSFNIGQAGYPYNLLLIYPRVSRTTSLGYPRNLACIYPPVDSQIQENITSFASLGYPHNLELIYPPVSPDQTRGYPHNLAIIYRPVGIPSRFNTIGYPRNLTLIYPPIYRTAGYPHNLANIYPAVVGSHERDKLAGTVVPRSDRRQLGYPYNLRNLYPTVATTLHVDSSATNSIGYPYNLGQLYAPVYPFNLDHLYAPVSLQNGAPLSDASSTRSSSTTDGYPFNLMNIYPSALRKPSPPRQSVHHYPHNLSNIYPPVDYALDTYPHNLNNLYPPLTDMKVGDGPVSDHCDYPFFNLYPSQTGTCFAHYALHTCNPKGQYPFFDIYPSTKDLIERSSSLASTSSPYPYFNLYPAVYPYFDLYPGPLTLKVSSPPLAVSKPHSVATTHVRYPIFDLYPAVYPHFDLYPAPVTVSAIKHETPAASRRSTLSSSRLTHAELHAMVMMEKMGSLRMTQRMGPSNVASSSDDIHRRTERLDKSGLDRSDVLPRSSLSRTPSYSQELRRPPLPPSLLSRRPPMDSPPRVSASTLPPSILRQSQYSALAPGENSAIVRSSSLRSSPNSKPDAPPPVKVPARRRDSLVFRRVQAFDSTDFTAESATLNITKETLAKFPMPPRMPLPPLPTDFRK